MIVLLFDNIPIIQLTKSLYRKKLLKVDFGASQTEYMSPERHFGVKTIMAAILKCSKLKCLKLSALKGPWE